MGRKVKQSFVLVTGGDDHEVDSLAIMWECLSSHTQETAERMLQYLTARVQASRATSNGSGSRDV